LSDDAPTSRWSISTGIGNGITTGCQEGRAIEAQLAARAGHPIPMNIDGATGVVFAELGFAPPLCRGLFVLSRSVGALAHAYEEMQSGERNKGPIPRDLTWSYTGPPPREVPERGE